MVAQQGKLVKGIDLNGKYGRYPAKQLAGCAAASGARASYSASQIGPNAARYGLV
jgi:hypothetical protein